MAGKTYNLERDWRRLGAAEKKDDAGNVVLVDGKRVLVDAEYISDTLSGFSMRVTPAGSKAWRFRYYPKDRSVAVITLGKAGEIPPALNYRQAVDAYTEARAQAIRAQNDDRVKDPAAARKAQREAKAAPAPALPATLTIRQAIDHFTDYEDTRPITAGRKQERRSRLLRWLEPHFERDLSEFNHTAASGARDMIMAIHKLVCATGRSSLAKNLGKDLANFFAYQCNANSRLIQVSPMPVKLLWGKETERHRIIGGETNGEGRNGKRELVEFIAAIAGEKYPYRHAWQALLLTALRHGAVINAEWTQIDLAKRLWIVPPEKNAYEHVVPIGGALYAVLVDAQRAQREKYGDGCKYVFSGNGRKPISGLDPSPWKEAVDANGVPVRDGKGRRTYLRRDDVSGSSQERVVARMEAAGVPQEPVDQWQVHDLRRTASTLLAALGCPQHVRDYGILHHKPKKLDATYNRYDMLDEKRTWLAALAAHLAGLGLTVGQKALPAPTLALPAPAVMAPMADAAGC